MENDLKEKLRKIANSSEEWMARSIVKWKYKRDGRPLPEKEIIDEKGAKVAREAKEIIAHRGKRIWNELKQAYKDGASSKKDSEK